MLEKFIRQFFAAHGRFVAEHPVGIFVTAALFVVVAAVGCTRARIDESPTELWVEPGTQTALDLDYFNAQFNPFFRVEEVILSSPTNVVTNQALLQSMAFNDALTNTEDPVTGVKLRDICWAPLEGKGCLINSWINYFQNNMSVLEGKLNMSNPLSAQELVAQGVQHPYFKRYRSDLQIPTVGITIFGTQDLNQLVHPNTFQSKATLMTYLIKNSNDPEYVEVVRSWEKNVFLKLVGEWAEGKASSHVISDKQDVDSELAPAMEGITVDYMAQRSVQDAVIVEESKHLSIVFSYLLMFLYITVALGYFSKVHSKMWAALMGIFIVICSIIASVGFCSTINVPLTLIILDVIPFLLVAIGVDNMFIISNEFFFRCRVQQRRLPRGVPLSQEHITVAMGEALGEVGATIFLAGTSEGLAFSLGALTSMPAVQAFCLYSGVAILVNLGLQVTVFVAFLTLDARRVASGRYDVLLCARHPLDAESVVKHNPMTEEGSDDPDFGVISSPTLPLGDDHEVLPLLGNVGGVQHSSSSRSHNGHNGNSSAAVVNERRDSDNCCTGGGGGGDPTPSSSSSPAKSSSPFEEMNTRASTIESLKRDNTIASVSAMQHHKERVRDDGFWSMAKGIRWFLREHYVPKFLFIRPVQIAAVVLFVLEAFCILLFVSPHLRLGLNPSETIPDNFYLRNTLVAIEKYLEVGPLIYFASPAVGQPLVNFSNPAVIPVYQNLEASLKQTAYIEKSTVQNWLNDFRWFLCVDSAYSQMDIDGNTHGCINPKALGLNVSTYLDRFQCDPETNHATVIPDDLFIPALKQFINSPQCCFTGPSTETSICGFQYDEDIIFGKAMVHPDSGELFALSALTQFDDDSEGVFEYVTASRMRMQTVRLSHSSDFIGSLGSAYNATNTLNALPMYQEAGVSLFPYSVYFVFYSQYLTLPTAAAKQVGLAVGAVVVVTFLILSSLSSTLSVTLCIMLILINLSGLMVYWDIEVNAISVVNLVMCVGISVEFCAHIAVSFCGTKGPIRRRMMGSMVDMGSNVVCGITLTKLLGVSVLAFSPSAVFRKYYFKMYASMVFLGALHGLVFLPCLLLLIGATLKQRRYKFASL